MRPNISNTATEWTRERVTRIPEASSIRSTPLFELCAYLTIGTEVLGRLTLALYYISTNIVEKGLSFLQ